MLFLAKELPMITLEQEDFLRRLLDIPFTRRSWKRLVTLDTLHTPIVVVPSQAIGVFV